MATFEEKILAYLDGSLPSEGRDELIAGMSGNSASAVQNRALFDAHIRMADMMTLAQKPVSAPLSMQRDLASKIPVLAVKLPYLASEKDRRNTSIAGWPMRYVNTILFAVLAIVAGCVWFAVNQKDGTPPGSAASDVANGSNAAAQNGGLPTAQNPAQNISSSNANVANTNSAVNGNAVSSNRFEVSHPHHAVSNNTGNVGSQWVTPISENLAEQNSPNARTENNQAQNNQSQNNQAQNENSGAKAAKQNPQSENGQQTLHSAKIPPTSPAEIIGSPTTIHSLSALNERGENDDPIRVFAVEEYRFIRINPQPALTDFSRSTGLQKSPIGFESPEFGIDYALDPWISVGLRGGEARFVQEQSVTTPSNTSYKYLGSEVRETLLLDPYAVWFGPAISYTIPASESSTFTGTFAFGDALVTALSGAISPIVRGELAFLYDFSSALALRIAGSYEADWTPSATPLNFTPSSAGYTSGVVIGSNAATHESQAFGISLGISFHP